MEFQLCTGFEDLRRLFSHSPTRKQSLFASLEWFELLARFATPDPASVVLPTVIGPGPDCVCLPMIRTADGLASLSNFYSGLFGPIESGVDDTSFRQHAIAELCHRLRDWNPHPARINIFPLDTDAPFFAHLRDGLLATGYLTDSYFCFGNWYLPCDGFGFSTYFEQRPSRVRNTVKRARNKLDRAGDWQARVLTGSGPALELAIDDFERIYRLSWKPEETYPQFIRELCRLAVAQGWLRLGILSLNGAAIASQIWLVENQKAMIFKLSYDPDAANLSPGSVLTATLMEHVLDQDRVTEIDYLSGDDAYKQEWMTHRRERHGIVAFDLRTIRGFSGALRHQGGLLWRRIRSRR
jgi:hypothetical protein